MRHAVRPLAAALCIVLPLFAACGRGSKTSTTAASDSTESAVTPLERGQQAFLSNCAICHGPTGGGNGELAAGLKKAHIVPAHLDDAARLAQLGREGVRRVIIEGGGHTGRSNLMPPWGEALPAQTIEDVTDYVLTLPSLKPGASAETMRAYLSAPAGTPDAGRRLYVYYCSVCHGPYGKGDGTYADTLAARNGIRPRNLTDSTYIGTKADRDLYAVISEGGAHMGKSPFMPSWTVTLSPEQIKDLVSYVRSISHTPSR